MPCILSACAITCLYPINNTATIHTSLTQATVATNLHEEMSINFINLLCSIYCLKTIQPVLTAPYFELCYRSLPTCLAKIAIAEPKLSKRNYRSCRCHSFTFTREVLVCSLLLFRPALLLLVCSGMYAIQQHYFLYGQHKHLHEHGMG